MDIKKLFNPLSDNTEWHRRRNGADVQANHQKCPQCSWKRRRLATKWHITFCIMVKPNVRWLFWKRLGT